ncbi:MAG TPA: ABC transporter substrate-binding protein [Acidimicrobiales bacterium]|nr:ABC transporter substrate-binding protein [Acidimicrobiales bacterium]
MHDEPVRSVMVNRRRFLQLGASLVAVPALGEMLASPAQAASKGGSGKPDRTAILQFGEMQGVDYDPIHLAETEFFQLYAIFDTLVSYKPNGTIIPRLATSWKATSDSLRMTLRPGVKFQDGTVMDATAVAFSLNRALTDPSSTIKSELPMLGSVNVVDAGTIDLVLTQDAVLPLLFQLANQAGMIVSPTAVRKAGSSAAFSQAPVGAGPYAIDGPWFPTEKMSVRAWSGYWDSSGQTLGGIDFVNVAESARVNALRSGSMDICCGLLGTDAQALKGDSSIKLVTGPGNFIYGLNINITKAPLNDLRVRQAIAHAINRPAVNQALAAGLGTPAFQFATVNSPAYDASLNKLYPYDPAKAKRLLKAAGHANGVSFNSVIGATAAAYVQFGELIQSQLKEVGIDMTLQQVELAQAPVGIWGSPGQGHGTYDSAPIGGGLTSPATTDTVLRSYALSTGYENAGGVEVPGVAALLTQADAAKTSAQAAAAYKKINRIITQGVYAVVPVYAGPAITAYGDYLGGHPMPEFDTPLTPDFLRGLYITKGKKPV